MRAPGPTRVHLVLLHIRVAGMATLPGTVPRMMRPAPGQNYPRTGFPLEGKKSSVLTSHETIILTSPLPQPVFVGHTDYTLLDVVVNKKVGKLFDLQSVTIIKS